MNNVYLDNAATTIVIPEVITEMNKIMDTYYANPSSLHRLGLKAENRLKKARKTICGILKVNPKELIFTGSGTVANNIAIQGAVNHLKKFGNRIITSSTEHKSVLKIFEYLKTQGFEVIYVPVNNKGIVDLDKIKEVINKNTILVSIMAVNNETGSVNPINKIAKIINEYDHIYFHVDGVQALGKIPINLQVNKIDLFTISAHKIHGPKGIAALYIKNSVIIDKILQGSNQEQGYYPGTENMPGIIGFSEAVNHLPTSKQINKIYELKNYLAEKIKKEISDVIINTPLNKRSSPHILNVSFADINGEILIHSLESANIYISTGSACSSKKNKISHVIKALKLPTDYQQGSVRFSFSQHNTKKEIEYTFKHLKDKVKNLRKIIGGKK